MRITEKRLRSIIRSVIAENSYDGLPSSLETPKGHTVKEPLYAKNPERGMSVADDILRVTEELEAKNELGLASRLRHIIDDLKGVFEPHDVIN